MTNNADRLRRDARAENARLLGLSAPALALVLIGLIIPVGWLFYLSAFDDDGALTIDNYRRLIVQPSYTRILLTTFELSALTTILCIIGGYLLAYVLAQLPRRAAALGMVAVLMPFWTSILVRTYAWLVLLQRDGLVNQLGIWLGLWKTPLALVYNMTGTTIGLVHIMLPFMVLPLFSSMRAIDRDYIKAAASLGANPLSAFWRVYFPLTAPGLAAGTVMVFILCLGSYVTPAVLGGGKVIMVANAVANNIELYFSWGPASAVGVVLLVTIFIALFIASRLTRLERILGASQ